MGDYPEERWAPMLASLAEGDRDGFPRRVGLVDGDAFDHAHFGLSAAAAARMSAPQRLILEAVADALVDAGIPAHAGTRSMGVFVASSAVDAAVEEFTPGRRADIHSIPAGGAGMLATPLMRWLDSRGPLVTVDTSCSSGMAALHMGRQAIACGDVDVAVVVGANSVANAAVTSAFHRSGVLAEDGRCKPFDASADGYVRSEGVVVAVLQEADLARADRNRVYAHVVHTELGADGRSRGGTGAPSRAAQATVIRDCHRRGGIDASAVGYVEAHGTGTVAGDLAEALAFDEVFERSAESPVLVGSTKGTFGHLEGGAALLSVLTAALAVHRGQIPPTAGHTTPSHQITRRGLAVRTPTRVLDWHDTERTAGVHAVGFSGALGHAVLTSPVPLDPGTGPDTLQRERPVLVPVSAAGPAALASTADTWSELAAPPGTDLERMASTAALRRDHHPYRGAVVAATPAGMRTELQALARSAVSTATAVPRRRPRLAFVFAGQGTQLSAMGAELAAEPAYTRAAAQAQKDLADHPGHRPWAPGTAPAGVAQVQQAVYAHQLGLAALLTEYLTPDLVSGHSLGELAAARTSGALGARDAARVMTARSTLLDEVASCGGLLATALGADAALEWSHTLPNVEVAAYNGPTETVFTGPTAALERLAADLARQGVWARPVPDGPPAHSSLLDAHLAGFASAISPLSPHPTSGTAFFSTMATEERGTASAPLDAPYWGEQLRHPVDLHRTLVRMAADDGPLVVIEVGARSVLAESMRATLSAADLPGTVIAAEGDHPNGEYAGLLTQVAHAYTAGLTPTGWGCGDDPHPPAALPLMLDHGSTPVPPVQDAAGDPTAWVRAMVADLVGAPLDASHNGVLLEDLGASSADRARLRASIARALPGTDLSVEHAPTISGIATAITALPHQPVPTAPTFAGPHVAPRNRR